MLTQPSLAILKGGERPPPSVVSLGFGGNLSYPSLQSHQFLITIAETARRAFLFMTAAEGGEERRTIANVGIMIYGPLSIYIYRDGRSMVSALSSFRGCLYSIANAAVARARHHHRFL